MIIVDTACREEARDACSSINGVTGYSEIPNAHGVGESGVRMGSGAHPKTSSIFFTVVEADQVAPLKERHCALLLRRLQERHEDDPMGRRGGCCK